MVANAKKRSTGGQITVKNDGVVLASGVNCVNFEGGTEVEAVVTSPGEVTVYHPAPTFQPYWPLGVSDPISRSTTRIATPESGEGFPFKTGGWAGTNQSTSRTTSFSLNSPGNRTGFGGDSTFEVKVFDADGVALLDSYTTPALTGNGTHVSPSGRITVTIANYGTDNTRWQADPGVTVDILDIFTDNGLDGGRYHVEATHITDTVSDGAQVLTFTQTDVFLDTNATTPFISTISGSVNIAETPGFVVTKHLSGLEYYILGSDFSVTVSGINQLNRNTARTSANLRIRGADYGLPARNHSPFGTGSSYFEGWTNDHLRDAVIYRSTDWAINDTNYRFIGTQANIDGRPRDTWAVGPTVVSPNDSILVDTYGITSNDTFEGFDDEARREFIDGIAGAATVQSFGGAGSYDSEQNVLVSGTTQAMVQSSCLKVPSGDWTTYKPNLNGTNPDYSSLTIPCHFARRFTQGSTANIPSFSMVFSGSWAFGNALNDIAAGAVEIYVYRVDKPTGTPGVIGPPPTNTTPLRVHVPFNFALYDDGATVPGSGIREGSSSGNTINCTFGTGTPGKFGFYCHIIIKNVNTQICSVSVTFF